MHRVSIFSIHFGRFLSVNKADVKKALPWVGDRRMVSLNVLWTMECVL